MSDPLTELERLHEAAGEPIVAIFDESLVVDYIKITIGGVRVDELPESEQDALGRFAMALLNNSSFLLKQARLAATLTSILCADEGQDVVERAKDLVRQELRLACEHGLGSLRNLDDELQQADDAAQRAGFDAEKTTPAKVIDSLRAALAAKDTVIDEMLEVFSTNPEEYRADPVGAMRLIEKHLRDARAELDRMKGRVTELLKPQAKPSCPHRAVRTTSCGDVCWDCGAEL